MRAARVVLLGLVLGGCLWDGASGRLVSSSPTFGPWDVEPTRCTVMGDDRPPTAVVLSSRADPLRYVLVQRVETPVAEGTSGVASILAGTTFELVVTDLGASGEPRIRLTSADCHELGVTTRPAFQSRMNLGPVLYHYAGRVDYDCDWAGTEHALVGHVEFTCPFE